MKLSEWQKTIKPRSCLIYNASTQDGLDGSVPFPIGMGYKFMLFDGTIEESQIGPHNRDVICAISPWTDTNRRKAKSRLVIIKNLDKNGIKNITLDPKVYFQELPKYKFVISPEGNGIDCHRHYEALMAGCIPILERNPHIEEKYKGCPILWTTDYSEITIPYLQQKYCEMIESTYDFKCLYLESYSPETQTQIKLNGNFWGQGFTGKEWYN